MIENFIPRFRAFIIFWREGNNQIVLFVVLSAPGRNFKGEEDLLKIQMSCTPATSKAIDVLDVSTIYNEEKVSTYCWI